MVITAGERPHAKRRWGARLSESAGAPAPHGAAAENRTSVRGAGSELAYAPNRTRYGKLQHVVFPPACHLVTLYHRAACVALSDGKPAQRVLWCVIEREWCLSFAISKLDVV